MNAENQIRQTLLKRFDTPNMRTTTTSPRVVIAEDDEDMASLLLRAFEKAGYIVTVCHNGWDLLRILGIFPAHDVFKDIDIVVSDIRLPGMSGLDVLKTCGYVGGFPPVILITAFGDDWTHEKARKLGAAALLDKPFDIGELIDRVRRLVPA